MGQANVRAIITAEDRASAVVRQFGDNVSGVGDRLAHLRTQALVAGAAITAAFTGVATLGIKSAASYEQNRVAFEGMLGSAAKAQKLLHEIAVAGKETPFELSDLVEGGKRLLAYGVAADDLVPTLRRLGDITSIVGTEKMPQLILAYGQVKAATHLTGAELRQFSEAGVPLLATLASRAKTSVADMTDSISKGKVSFEEVDAALKSMTVKGGIAFEAMKRQSKTFNGVISNIKDSATIFLNSVMGIDVEGNIRENSIFAFAHQAAEGLYQFIDANQGRISNSIQNLVAGVELLATGNFRSGMFGAGIGEDAQIVSQLLAVREAFEQLFHLALDVGRAALDGLRQAFDFLRPSLMGVVEAVRTDLVPALKRLWDDVLVPMAPVIGTVVVGALWLLINALRVAIEVTAGVIDVFTRLFNFFTVTLPTGIGQAVGFIGDKLTWLANHSNEAVGFIIGYFLSLPVKLPLIMADAIGRVIGTLSTVNWAAVFGVALSAWINAWIVGFNWLKAAFNDLIRWMTNLRWGDVGKNFANNVLDLIQGAINGAMAGVPGMPKFHLPHLAKGTDYFEGGLALVGEKGPELVSMPRGSRVTPNDRLTELGGSTVINISPQIGVYAGTEAEKRKLARELFEALRDVAGARNMTVGEMLS